MSGHSTSSDSTLIGRWIVDKTDAHALAMFGDILIEFKHDGDLIYTIRNEEKRQIIKLRYKTEGGTLVTDQPSSPKIERTAFVFSEDGSLTLTFDGVPSRFKRCHRDAP